MTPVPLVLDVIDRDASTVIDEITPGLPSLILWEITPGTIAEVAQCLMTIDARFPRVLQLVADSGLSFRERSMVSEFPVGVVGQTVAAGLVVTSRPMDRCISLGDVKVDGPRT